MTTHIKHAVRWILGIAVIASLAPSATAESTLLRVWLKGPIFESPQPASLNLFTGAFSQPKNLHEWVSLIDEAATSDKVDGMVLVIDSPMMGFSQAEELRRSLINFREAGKKVYAYLDTADNLDYLLATAADHITLADHSTLDIVGLGIGTTYFKGLLDKVGIEADMLHVGDFKTAAEPFTRTEPSEAAAEQINWLLDGLFERFFAIIAESRQISPETVKTLIDQAPLDAKIARENKLIDAVGGFPAFRKMLRTEFGGDVRIIKKLGIKQQLDVDFENPFALIRKFNELLNHPKPPAPSGIALIYVDGTINIGPSQEGGFGSRTAGSSTIRAALQEVGESPAIKAVVLRVDSPGGSALASDIICDAAQRVAQRKPLIVSMGNVAGSGGYYVACPGDIIFAEETTLTGSIGVVGGKLVWRNLMEEKLGIHSYEFTRGKNANLFSANQRFTESQRSRVVELLETTYEQFKSRVLETRANKLKQDLESIAGGRVYTGRQALDLGLVDRIGGLNDAIEYAANQAGLASPPVHVFPEPKDLLEEILSTILGQDSSDIFEVTVDSDRDAISVLKLMFPLLESLGPRDANSIATGLENLLIIQRERVGCFMPFSDSAH